METIWQQAKKQGFSVLLLLGACIGMFTYFTNENKALRIEYKAEIKEIRMELSNCLEERLQDLKTKTTALKNSNPLSESVYFSSNTLFISPKREEEV